MLRRIWLHRRRLVLGFVILITISIATADTFVAMLHAMSLSALVMVAFAVWIMLRPRAAAIVELFVLTLALREAFFALSPTLGHYITQASPLINVGLLLMLYYLLFNLANSANGFRWPGTLGLRAERVIDAPRDRVWRALDAGEAGHWDPDVADAERSADGLRLTAAGGTAAGGTALVTDGSVETVPQIEEGRFRLSHRVPPTPDGIGLTERLTLGHRGRGATRIALTRSYSGLPFMTALNLWLSGHPGELLDRLADDLRTEGAEGHPVAQPGVPTSPTVS